MPNKNQILDLLWNEPVKIGHFVGFKDLQEMHNEWLKSFIQKEDDQTLQGHRGSYKTTALSIFLALHAIMKPNENVIFFRKTDTDVQEVMRQTGNILLTGCFKQIVGTLYGVDLKLLKNSNTEIQTNLTTAIKGASQIVGLGINTSITGKHADVVVTDDIVNLKDRISTAERERTKIAYQELQNVKNRGGRFINTGTPWHKEDAFTMMPNPAKYDCYSTGLMTDDDIAKLKDSMVPSLFAANYELKHIAGEDVIFCEPVMDADESMAYYGLSHTDSAFYGSDSTAFTVMRAYNGKLYVFGKLWRKHVEDCYDMINMLYTKFRCSKMYMEKNADKGFVARDMKKLGLKVVPYDESMNKYIKIVTYLKKVWKDIVFVEGTDLEYIEQITDYTENSEHDDAPDSAACLVRAIYPKIDKEPYKPIIYT